MEEEEFGDRYKSDVLRKRHHEMIYVDLAIHKRVSFTVTVSAFHSHSKRFSFTVTDSSLKHNG